jgi:hypothetical protein
VRSSAIWVVFLISNATPNPGALKPQRMRRVSSKMVTMFVNMDEVLVVQQTWTIPLSLSVALRSLQMFVTTTRDVIFIVTTVCRLLLIVLK